MRKPRIQISKDDLADIDHIIGRVYETDYIDPDDETEDGTEKRLAADKEVNGQIVNIDIDTYLYPKLRHLLDFLYQERFLFKLKENDITYSEEHDFLAIEVIRPFEAENEYTSYLYTSLFNPAKCDIDQLKRLALLLEEMHSFPCNVSEIFKYKDVKPSPSNLGASSLAEFEKLILSDLQFLHEEKVIPYLDIIEDYVSIDYSRYAVDRLQWAINFFLASHKEIPLNSEKADMVISFHEDLKVVLNDTLVISKPNFDSENELVFRFLYENPNKKWSKQEIEQQIKVKIHKSFDKIVENLGFKNDLRRIFWHVSSTTVQFNNPVSNETIEKLKLKHIRI